MKNKKNIDNKIENNNVEETGLTDLPSNPEPTNEEQYIVSPDGRYKFLKSDLDSDLLEETSTRIPVIKRPGYVIVWPHDIKATSIPNMVAKGWQFVNPKIRGCEAAAKKVVAGRTETGDVAFHYAMEMPEDKFKEMKAREEEERKRQENAIKLNPSAESKDIYGTEQMSFSRSVGTGAKMN